MKPHTKGGLPRCPCPTCGYVVDSATHVGDKEISPNDGDLSLCLKCGEILVFNPDLSLRASTLNDLMGLPADTNATLERAQTLIRAKRFIK